MDSHEREIPLPPPRLDSPCSVEAALQHRRSVRSFLPQPLTLAEVAQLLWAAQGLTSGQGLRTAPSAGALYPLTLYLAAGEVHALPAGVYRYRPRTHALTMAACHDRRPDLSRAALRQTAIATAPAALVFAADYQRTTEKYGSRGIRYVHMDQGHAAENVCLQAVALGLGAVVVGAFDDQAVAAVLRLPPAESPLAIVPVGRIGVEPQGPRP